MPRGVKSLYLVSTHNKSAIGLCVYAVQYSTVNENSHRGGHLPIYSDLSVPVMACQIMRLRNGETICLAASDYMRFAIES